MAEHTDDVGAELRRAVTRLASRFRSERLEGEVPDAALQVLVVLEKRGGMSLTELAASAHVTLGSMSQTVRRLEALGHLTKSRDDVDRRRVVFQLTAQGSSAADASLRHRRDWLNARLAELTEDELADIARAAPLLLRLGDS
ncbi:MarR family winged helix-turn-helix transcriptional regulator [Protaetiibacter mangrovi]|uniref:MarR family transcriptional regulator n=1 Tax=Protaetiibacter mangrovi TaxID=2970926 RepID=A0ABT1ZD12_9MICO|nr:MarR family transcriptional regulator [Protaetiibacter mangrovi]MCS0498571.1 MarR family transcriptional regulator [Protaetiibacter mangrovi]